VRSSAWRPDPRRTFPPRSAVGPSRPAPARIHCASMLRPSRPPRASSYLRRRATSEASEARRVKALLAAPGLSPRKRFGQNFLVREEIAERIVEHCRLDLDDVAVEIGPGAGALTLRLARRVRRLVAVEMDRGLAAVLREDLGGFPGVDLVEGDFLALDLAP